MAPGARKSFEEIAGGSEADVIFGQLGDDSRADSNVPRLVVGLTNATAVACGFEHTCALATKITAQQ